MDCAARSGLGNDWLRSGDEARCDDDALGSARALLLGDTVRIEYAENAGGFLSLGANLPPVARTAFFTVATGLMVFVLIIFALRRTFAGMPALGLTLFAAGGASNWIDRIVRGSVVDFLNVGVASVRTGVFNVADVAIMLGAGIFVLSEFRHERDSPSSAGRGAGTA